MSDSVIGGGRMLREPRAERLTFYATLVLSISRPAPVQVDARLYVMKP